MEEVLHWGTALIGLPLGLWIYLLFFRGHFWREQVLPPTNYRPAVWPSVTAIVPARNESDVISHSLQSLLDQDYPGAFRILVIDDQSEDKTILLAQRVLADQKGAHAARVIQGSQRPAGWVGKMWALEQGMMQDWAKEAQYIWFTDADIAHEPNVLRSLVARATEKSYLLVSLMAKLQTVYWIERALIPAYIYFFMKLYPFRWIRDHTKKLGGAAGGCMLVDRAALVFAGGIAKIKHAIIDDCSMGSLLKRAGPIWLGLAAQSYSLRPYRHWREIWQLIARSAFTQLGYSSLMLWFSLLGLALAYLAPIFLLESLYMPARYFGWAAYGMLTLSYLPTLRYYRCSPFWAAALPMIALFFMAATLDSALNHWRGQGIRWKNRLQTNG